MMSKLLADANELKVVNKDSPSQLNISIFPVDNIARVN